MDRIEREIEIDGPAVAADVLAQLMVARDAYQRTNIELGSALAEMTAERDSESRWAAEYKAERDALAAELAAIKAEVPGLLDKLIRAATYLYSGWTPAEAAPHWADVDAAIDLAARLRGEEE